ncbi:MAG: hypothetical protein RBU21_14445 [FCB group bacterium]|jgi:hypothetical protein|nr:hypothetical protein [FCB group bacterium]
MPQSKKATAPRTPASRTSRGMSEGPKSTASAPKATVQKPSAMSAMDDKPKGTDKKQHAIVKSKRARRSDSGA